MATKIRLQRGGRKGYAFYGIVIADVRAPRDGKFIERIGSYNPNTNPATIDLNFESTLKWLQNGAEPTATVKNILSFKGVMYKKHLLRGVQLGVVKAEEVETKFTEWVEKKEGKISDHKAKADAKKKATLEAVVNTPAKVKEVPAEETPAVEEAPAVEASENTETAE